jgi:Na+-transporting NADH:ubiquinone oxidoreductase subunit C
VQVNSIRYTLLFATAVCLVCSMLVASATVLLRDRQHANQLLYLQKNVLQATGLLKPGEQMSDREVVALFERSIRIRLVDLQTGDYVESPSVDPSRYDQRRARADPAQSREAPPNLSQIKRLPNLATVALVVKDGKPVQVVLPIEGIGLYGTLYGFVALDRDLTTIRGLAFYENRETPGLGGEVDNPKWKAQWPGRKAFDEAGKILISLKKGGGVGSPEKDPYQVDALSGATITSNGVTRMLHFWLGENGFGPYLAKVRARGGL